MARAWRGGVLGAVFCAACVSPAWATVNVEGVPFDDAARVAGRELLLNGTGLRSVFVIKGYVAGLYLPERAKNAAVILGMKGPKRLQIHPLRDVGADTFIHALNDGMNSAEAACDECYRSEAGWRHLLGEHGFEVERAFDGNEFLDYNPFLRMAYNVSRRVLLAAKRGRAGS